MSVPFVALLALGPVSRTAMRWARAGQYRAETTITVTNATMNHSPPFKPNTHCPYGTFPSPASPQARKPATSVARVARGQD